MPVNILKQVKEFWVKLSKKLKITIIFSLVAIIFISIVASVLLNINNHDILYSGLSSSEQAEIVARLNELGVDVKTESGGIILVPADKVASLKMQLSSEGYPKSTLTYDLFKDNSDFMTTDFDKKQYLIFQLQDRLQESIKTLSGVKNAIVTISVSNESSYVLSDDKIPSTASLIIDCEHGMTLSKQQIKGIENLIAKSIPGLENNNITIIDSDGNILNSNSNPGSGISLENFEIEKAASEMFESKIITLLQPLYGKNGISAAVNVSIDFSKKSTDELIFTPVNMDNTPSGTDAILEDPASGVPGASSNTSDTTITGEDNENPGATTVTIPNETDSNTLVNQVQNQIVKNGGEIKDVTAAIIINKELSDDDKQTINQIVAFALGVKSEKVLISGMAFTAINEMREQASKEIKYQNKINFFDKYAKYIIPAAIAVASGVFILLFMKTLTSKKEEKEESVLGGIKPIGQKQPQTPVEEVPAIVLSETRELGLKRQIKDFSSSNPEIVAQLLRTWLKEEND